MRRDLERDARAVIERDLDGHREGITSGELPADFELHVCVNPVTGLCFGSTEDRDEPGVVWRDAMSNPPTVDDLLTARDEWLDELLCEASGPGRPVTLPTCITDPDF